jgi:hypothetical protein
LCVAGGYSKYHPATAMMQARERFARTFANSRIGLLLALHAPPVDFFYVETSEDLRV